MGTVARPLPRMPAGAPDRADPDDERAWFLALALVDWVVTPDNSLLHAVPDFTEEHLACLDQYDNAVEGPIELACGRTADFVTIPGYFTRGGCPRCPGCCDATGLPVGVGSPKNDPACRELLGLDKGGSG